MVLADAVGPFGEHVSEAGGIQLRVRFAPNPGGPLSLRVELGTALYGEDTEGVCLPLPVGCIVEADLVTDHDLGWLVAGPEVAVFGGRVHLFATAGRTRFTSTSYLSGTGSAGMFLATTNHRKTAFAVRAGGGTRFPLREGSTPVTLGVELLYHRTGTAEYLSEGELTTRPDGSLVIVPHRTRGEMVALQVGVEVGLGGGSAP